MAVPAAHPLKNLADKEPFQTPGQQINRAKNECTKPFRIVKMEKLAGVNQPSGLSLGTGKSFIVSTASPTTANVLASNRASFFIAFHSTT
ncbi:MULTISPECIES: hypothetical protein [Serratia]|uniref:hypothetical protein n=1 Tax=Serratia TaxID=613 RepID=UPI0012B5CBE0|nr:MULTISPECIES: hypothetical protein [Serratia]